MSASALQMELVAEARARRARLFGVPKSLRAIEAPVPQIVPKPEPIPAPVVVAPGSRDVLNVSSLPIDTFVVPANAGWEIIKRFCRERGVAFSAICSVRRHVPLVWQRQELCWLLKQGTSWSLPQIGRALGGRDHTTIMHAIRAHQKTIDNGGVRTTFQPRRPGPPADVLASIVEGREVHGTPHAKLARKLGITEKRSNEIYSYYLRRNRVTARNAAFTVAKAAV